jgi:hypothetical protein
MSNKNQSEFKESFTESEKGEAPAAVAKEKKL